MPCPRLEGPHECVRVCRPGLDARPPDGGPAQRVHECVGSALRECLATHRGSRRGVCASLSARMPCPHGVLTNHAHEGQAPHGGSCTCEVAACQHIENAWPPKGGFQWPCACCAQRANGFECLRSVPRCQWLPKRRGRVAVKPAPPTCARLGSSHLPPVRVCQVE